MLDLRRITEGFAVAPQPTPDDLAEIARQGYQVVIVNRPDGETYGQPTMDEMRLAAENLGLTFVNAPFQGFPPPDAIVAVEIALKSGRKTFAYCRSGTRSATAFVIGAVKAGVLTPEAAVAAAGAVGYELSPMLEALRDMA